MCRIYIDFDGVLVNTPEYIRREIEKYGDCEKTFSNIKWNELLEKCNEINYNLKYLRRIYKKYNNITILTHVYSSEESEEKRKFIRKYIGNINILFCPFNTKKGEYVNPANNLLIDDYKVNIIDWEKRGGIGYLFKNKKLEDILSNYLEEEIYDK